MLPGYNTSGFALHRLEDAMAILAEIGYRSVAITVERDLLDPPDRRGVARAVARLKPILQSTGLRATIETGSRFILDSRRKHQPTLLSANPSERARRIEFMKACMDLAAAVGADSVSLWSGSSTLPQLSEPRVEASGFGASHEATEPRSHEGNEVVPRPSGGGSLDPRQDASRQDLWNRLTESLRELLEHARAAGVRLAFEPEPGMYIDTMDTFAALERELADPLFGLTLDAGHVHCLSDGDPGEHIRRWREKLWNIHIEDMRRGVHEHLMFGEGDMDFPPIFAALREVGYAGPVHVELSRHSHDAVEAARRSFEFLRRFV